MPRRIRRKHAVPLLTVAGCTVTALLLTSLGLATAPAGAVPASPPITVTSLGDGADGTLSNPANQTTLREAVDEANADPDYSTIIFADGLSGTITLEPQAIETYQPLSIEGPGAREISIDGNAATRHFMFFGSETRISGLKLENGNPGGVVGGSIAAQGSDLTISKVAFEGNTAGGSGGAVRAFLAPVTIEDSTFSANSSGYYGGAIVANDAPLTIRRTTITGNASDESGGAIVTDSEFSITDSTITGNTAAGDGGGIFPTLDPGETATVTNSIIAGNVATAGHDLFSDNGVSPVYELAHSLIGTTHGSAYTETVGGSNILGSFGAEVDPLLEALADNGGPTDTHALPLSSPAVDHGATTEARDQRGASRLHGTPDIGAFERDVTGPVTQLGAVTEPTQQDRRATLAFTGPGAEDVDVQRFECSIDSGTYAPCSSPLTTADLPPGVHTIDVRAVDVAGNAGTAQRQSVTAPPLPVTPGPDPDPAPTTPDPHPAPTTPQTPAQPAQPAEPQAPASPAVVATPSKPAADTTAPLITRLRATKSRLRAASPAPLTMQLSEPATVDLTVTKAVRGRRGAAGCLPLAQAPAKGKRCTARVEVATRSIQQAAAGAASMPFHGKSGDEKLAPGVYRATLVATDAAGNRSKPKSVAIRIRRR